MTFSAAQVKELREKTGAGIMDAKKALVEHNGDMEKAMEYLRQKGIASADKKMGRIAAEGVVASYVADGVGAMVEINCETDFVAKNEEFKALANKPEQIRAKIVEGRVNKLMAQRCLIEQPFVKDPNQTIEQLISGKMEVKAFTRFMLGEGLEKKQENFAEEVMGQIKG